MVISSWWDIHYDLYGIFHGRYNTYIDHYIFYDENVNLGIDNPIDIVYDLLRSELGFSADQIDNESFVEAKYWHSEFADHYWHFNFSVTEEIDAKQLIQEILSFTKSFGTYNNSSGIFSLVTIKDNYQTIDDYDSATIIDDLDVISFNFEMTKPEEIYTDVNIKYNKDPFSGEYENDVLSYNDIEPHSVFNAAYNTTSEFYNIEKSENSFKIIECPYIKDHTAALMLRDYIWNNNRNSHLIVKLSLPLKYVHLRAGDNIRFLKLLGDTKAFGIDYRILQNPTYRELDVPPYGYSGQYLYPLFMVKSVSKSTTRVNIECIQLHHLDGNNPVDSYANTVGYDFIDIDPPEYTPYYVHFDIDVEGFSPIEMIEEEAEELEFGLLPEFLTDWWEQNSQYEFTNHMSGLNLTRIAIPSASIYDTEGADWSDDIVITHNGQEYNAGDILDLVLADGVSYSTNIINYSVGHLNKSLTINITSFGLFGILPTIAISGNNAGVWNNETNTHTVYQRPVEYFGEGADDYNQGNYFRYFCDKDYEGYGTEWALNNTLDFVGTDHEEGAIDVIFPSDFFESIPWDDIYEYFNWFDFNYPIIDLTQLGTYTGHCFTKDSEGNYRIKTWNVNVIEPLADGIDVMEGAGSGDINQDGILDILDIVQIVNWILDPDEDIAVNTDFEELGDINQDDFLNVLDIVDIINAILGLE